jgi:hypothetical protein
MSCSPRPTYRALGDGPGPQAVTRRAAAIVVARRWFMTALRLRITAAMRALM